MNRLAGKSAGDRLGKWSWTWASPIVLWLALVCGGATASFAALLVPQGTVWKYWDAGSNPPPVWREVTFDDADWAAGPAPIGYGETNVATEVSYGPDPDNKYVTTWFRQTFFVADPSAFNRIYLSVLRDDGVVVYLNGQEVYRNNLPPGPVDSLTLASTNVFGAGEKAFYSTYFGWTLNAGPNVLAVELHQAAFDSIDLEFDLQLSAALVPQVTRGPYLQSGTPRSVIVRWRTDVPSDSQVRYGTNPEDLRLNCTDGTLTTEHQVQLTGLQPDTKYYYAIGTTSEPLAEGSDYFFITAPLAAKPTRIWVIGDAGTANFNQRAVRDAYYAFAGSRYTDVWLMLGDNAYPSGTDQQYQAALFDMYPSVLRQTVAWSTIGNHETYSTYDFNNFPYLQMFSPPVNGEAGGVPSGTKKYYSFDYGNIHFVCLDAMTSNRSSNGVMCAWLRQDLLANTSDWVIAFWHHPPYTKGSHNSDWEGELIEMRENVVPILEAYGVDLVLAGHSHCYERSFLMNGHYGKSWTLTSEMIKNRGSGRPDETGAYFKCVSGPGANQGAIYAVAGSSGQATFTQADWPHPAMAVSLVRLGSLVLDVDGNSLNARFLREDGTVDDRFAITKNDGFLITAIQVRDGTVTVTWNSFPGQYYRVYRRNDWGAPWLPVSEGFQASSAESTWSETVDPAYPNAFYRIENYSD